MVLLHLLHTQEELWGHAQLQTSLLPHCHLMQTAVRRPGRRQAEWTSHCLSEQTCTPQHVPTGWQILSSEVHLRRNTWLSVFCVPLTGCWPEYWGPDFFAAWTDCATTGRVPAGSILPAVKRKLVVLYANKTWATITAFQARDSVNLLPNLISC